MFVTLVEFFLDDEGRDRFPSWVEKLGERLRNYPGLLDARRMTPPGEPERTLFMLLFDTEQNTRQWAESTDRQDLLALITPHWTKPFLPVQFLAGESLTPRRP